MFVPGVLLTTARERKFACAPDCASLSFKTTRYFTQTSQQAFLCKTDPSVEELLVPTPLLDLVFMGSGLIALS